jgi:PmbA protein
MTDLDDPRDLLADLIRRARVAGADAADALMSHGASLSVARRLGQVEKLERAEGRELGLRVFVGRRQAIVSTNDFAADALQDLVARAVAMARAVPEDPFCGIADPDQLARDWPDLDRLDPVEPSAETLLAWAAATEDAARSVPGVTNSEGAEIGWSRGRTALATSAGFAGLQGWSSFSASISVLAGEGTAMERDWDYAVAAHAADLPDLAAMGQRAGERAVRRLGPRKLDSARMPVVYEAQAARGLLSHLAGAISGTAIARGTSFLKDKLDQPIMPKGVTVTDDPHRPRGLRSRPFDAEGLKPRRRAIVADGRLTTWLMDLRSARQLGLGATGHASRGAGGPPGPSPANLYFEPGTIGRDALVGGIDRGIFVTDLMGMGVNGVTGDYSRGAAGFLIDKGEITHPVSEVTIAGNLRDMFANLTVADDLVFRYGIDAPTIRVDGMTVAGT